MLEPLKASTRDVRTRPANGPVVRTQPGQAPAGEDEKRGREDRRELHQQHAALVEALGVGQHDAQCADQPGDGEEVGLGVSDQRRRQLMQRGTVRGRRGTRAAVPLFPACPNVPHTRLYRSNGPISQLPVRGIKFVSALPITRGMTPFPQPSFAMFLASIAADVRRVVRRLRPGRKT